MASTPSFTLLLIFTLSLFFALSECFLLQLKSNTDLHSQWKFPKDRPYHYFNHTDEIPPTFLPVHVNALPKGDGLWVLRYKDFSGEAKTFSTDKRKDTSKSVLTFSSNAQLFDSVSIKALGFGDAQLTADFGIGKVALFEHNKECANSSSSVDENGMKWFIYQVQTTPTSHVKQSTTWKIKQFSLEGVIKHASSFIMLDEIQVYFGHNHNGKTKTANSDSESDSQESAEEHKVQPTENEVYCKVVL